MMKTKRSSGNHMNKRNYLRHLVPVMVWLGAVALVVWLFYQRTQRFEVVGIARGQIRQVAVSSTGRIREIAVDLFEPVRAGQKLAVVDTVLDNEQTLEAELKAQLAATGAEAERLAALLIPTQEQLQVDVAGLQINRADNQRRFAVDVENARLGILELQAAIASDRVTLNDLSMDVKILEDLLEKQAIAPYELQKVQVQYESLASKLKENERSLEQARADLKKAEERYEEFSRQTLPEQSVDHALEAIRKEITVQEQLMKGLLAQLAALETRRSVEVASPMDGVVIPVHSQANDALMQRSGEQVMRRTGEVVTAGDPILAIAQKEPTEIIAYVGQSQLGFVEEAMAVELTTIREPRQVTQSFVSSIGPTIELKPQRLWRNPNIAEWGRPVLIQIPPGLTIAPGEVIGIRGL